MDYLDRWTMRPEVARGVLVAVDKHYPHVHTGKVAFEDLLVGPPPRFREASSTNAITP